MNETVKQIISDLDEVFAPMDKEVLEASQVWAKERVAAIKAFKESEEYRSLRFDSGKLYSKLFALAGGKTWYNVFYGRNEAMIEEYIVKNCAAIVESRNTSIAKKLMKANVTEVTDKKFVRTNDGFNGTFVVMTDAGQKCVTIQTIRAGGYNIQCLHLRVLTKVH
jgi:hypothetical protein